MITTTDIANILYAHCRATLGIDTYQRGNIPDADKSLPGVRAVVIAKQQSPGTIWKSGFVEVNLCVPDIGTSADLARLGQLERAAVAAFGDGTVGQYDGSHYLCELEHTGIEQDAQLRCHYVNVRLNFKVLNVR